MGQKRILHKHCIEVEHIDLDSWAISTEGFEPDIIKIDVEGFELSVLKGSEKTIRTNRPAILLETTNEALANEKEIYQWFKK